MPTPAACMLSLVLQGHAGNDVASDPDRPRISEDMPENDDILLAACASGDEAAFAELVSRHLDIMHAFLARRCPRWHLVEEVAQEAFVRAWQGAGTFQGGSTVRTWLLGIARNVLSERLRSEPRHLAALDEVLWESDDHGQDGEGDGAAEAQVEAMRRCLQRLAPRARALITARYQEGRGIADLARAFKKKVDALARELQRLAVALRTCVQSGSGDAG